MKFKRLSLLLTLCVTMVSFTVSSCDKTNNSNQTADSSITAYTGYYESISPTATGTELLNQLHELNESKRTTIAYDDMRYKFQYTDMVPENNGKILSFYTNQIMNGQWDSGATYNREHVWPQSRGGTTVENDMHIIRPCSSSINSSRGNRVYGDGTNGTYDPGYKYINYRGIAARIVFYCVVANPSLVLNDLTDNKGNNMGKLSLLLDWNDTYPPLTSETATIELRVEQYRNNYIYENLQFNRNPFIDHPEFARRIWG